jgi:hypothetical protein
MVTYRWTGSHAYRDHAHDRVIDPGEELPADIADRVVTSHPHDVEELDEKDEDETADVDTDDPADDETESDDVDPHPGELTVTEIEERVADVDDREVLESIRELEANGDHRTTALEAIDARLDDLDG